MLLGCLNGGIDAYSTSICLSTETKNALYLLHQSAFRNYCKHSDTHLNMIFSAFVLEIFMSGRAFKNPKTYTGTDGTVVLILFSKQQSHFISHWVLGSRTRTQAWPWALSFDHLITTWLSLQVSLKNCQHLRKGRKSSFSNLNKYKLPVALEKGFVCLKKKKFYVH